MEFFVLFLYGIEGRVFKKYVVFFNVLLLILCGVIGSKYILVYNIKMYLYLMFIYVNMIEI